MTAIVGITNGKKIWMGADSLASSWYDCIGLAQPKIIESGPFLIGICGYVRPLQIIQYKLSLQDDVRKKDAMEFICVDFVDRLRQILYENDHKSVKENVGSIADGSCLLVGFRGRLFQVQSNFQVIERASGFDAIGSGQPYAIGSLHETAKNKKLSPEERITMALECAEKFVPSVRSPFIVLSSEHKQ